MEQLAFAFVVASARLGVGVEERSGEKPRLKRRLPRRTPEPNARLASLPKGACRLKLRPCVCCGKVMKARYPTRCRKCKRHTEVYDYEYEVHL